MTNSNSDVRIGNDAVKQVYCGIGEVLKARMGAETPLPANLERLMQALARAD